MSSRVVISFCSIVLVTFLYGCSSSAIEKKAVDKPAKDSVMVFEESAPDTLNKNSEIRAVLEKNNRAKESAASSFKFSIQLGAFSTLEKADNFAIEAKKKSKKELSVAFNEAVKLFVVQVVPAFENRADADALRDHLWKIKEFKDAWIVLVDE